MTLLHTWLVVSYISTQLLFVIQSLFTMSVLVPSYYLGPGHYLQFLFHYPATIWDPATICNSCSSTQLLFTIPVLISTYWSSPAYLPYIHSTKKNSTYAICHTMTCTFGSKHKCSMHFTAWTQTDSAR